MIDLSALEDAILQPDSQVQTDTPIMDTCPPGFEESDELRSAFIRDITLYVPPPNQPSSLSARPLKKIPRTLIRYWHDPSDLPDDVRDCLSSWERLAEEGFELRMFCDKTALAYIGEQYGSREHKAFLRCRHPAMRSDYLRMCFVLAEGGFYVDADDALLGDGWKDMFNDGRLKVQPLCYDIPTGQMISAAELWRVDLPTNGRIFYLNNNPIAAPPGHPVLQRALTRATNRLLGFDPLPEIQSTTGPGNFTAALAAHARDLLAAGDLFDFELLRDWGAIAETRWHLSYRGDSRNWRNMDSN
ncbi:MAG: glycosyltransferase [Erythrobacter sp.]|uniref:glycosyltransferase family 32 protein n=1 Tax=Erythrobacter sp. TaxID=1042 RepID=UPI0032646B05